MHVAAFVTPHGFGHAGRASAVLDALHARRPDLRTTLVTTTPEAFFRSSLQAPWRRVATPPDVGLVQTSALSWDLPATARRVAAFLDVLPSRAEALGRRLREEGVDVVLCDIAPLGIAAARCAGVPSVLVENFTWDWIYESLVAEEPALEPIRRRMADLYAQADVRVRPAPVEQEVPGAVGVAPIARAPRLGREAARRELGIEGDAPAVLVTLGGVPQELPFLDALRARDDVTWVVTGLPRGERDGPLRFLHRERPVYLPDTLRAVDAVVAKLGYSTVAEAWRTGRPLAWVPRPEFREGPVLARWVADALPGFPVERDDFLAGAWIERVDALLALPPAPEREGGADAAARILQAAADGLGYPVAPGVEPRR